MRAGYSNISDTSNNDLSGQNVEATPQSSYSQTVTNSNLNQNLSSVAPYTIWGWLAALVFVMLYFFVKNHEKVDELISKDKIFGTIYYVFGVGIAAGVGIKGLHILFTKLASMNIPVLSRIAALLLPTYS